MSIRILVCGDRNWDDKSSVEAVIDSLIDKYGNDISVIHGAATGADSIAGTIATDRDLVTVSVPAKWEEFGKAAGPMRNGYMLTKCKPNLVVAFHNNISASSGTKHMVGIAKNAGVKTIVVDTPAAAKSIANKLPQFGDL